VTLWVPVRAKGCGLPYTLALMIENGVRQSLLGYLSERPNGPFGDVESVSGRTLQPFSFAGQRAAENLLIKARRALDNNDVDRARAFVDRAVRLPFDEHEGAAPAALAVHMDLFCVVTDALEQAEADDSRWLACDHLTWPQLGRCSSPILAPPGR
jgi:hypothetical protein